MAEAMEIREEGRLEGAILFAQKLGKQREEVKKLVY